MRQFKDTAGRSWTIAINVAAIKRLRDLLKVDLPGLFDDAVKPLAALLSDPCKLVDVVWLLTLPRDGQADVTDEEFGMAMGGDALASASDAFLEELIDFFPQAKATNLRKLMTETKKVQSRIEARAASDLDSFDADAMAERLISSFGTVPASSASLPGSSPSAS
jgi:hypothetical protein